MPGISHEYEKYPVQLYRQTAHGGIRGLHFLQKVV